MELIYSGSFESLPVGASPTNASMAGDSDMDYGPPDEEGEPASSSAGAKAKGAAQKSSGVIRQWLMSERPAQVALQNKARCKRDLVTLDLELAAPQPSGKRQRKPVQQFEAGSATCFIRKKPAPAPVTEPPVKEYPPLQRSETWARTDTERDRKQAQFDCQAKKRRAEQRAKKKAAEIAELVGVIDQNEEFSWRQRRKLGLKAFASALQYGYSKMVGYHVATFAASVGVRSVQAWVKRWRRSREGFEASFNWGGQHSASILMEEDVVEASRTWWRENAPKKGPHCFHLFAPYHFFFRQSASSHHRLPIFPLWQQGEDGAAAKTRPAICKCRLQRRLAAPVHSLPRFWLLGNILRGIQR